MRSLFRKLSPESACFYSLFHRHIRGLSFSAGDSGMWRADSAASGSGTHGATAYATLGDGEVTVWLNSPDWLVAAGKVLGVRPERAAELPDELQLAALECFASAVFSAIERGTGLPVALTRMEKSETVPLSSACFFSLTDPDGLRVRGAWSAAIRGTWHKEAEKALLSLPVGTRGLPDDFLVGGEVCVGMWGISASELFDLSNGDVVLSPSGLERTVCVGGRYRFAARLNEGVLKVDGKSMTDISSGANDADGLGLGGGLQPEAGVGEGSGEGVAGDGGGVGVPAEGESGGLGRIDDVRVEMHARVGTLGLTLGELRALGEGQVVEFSTPVESPASLVVNGRVIARGELLDVGGRVGVRITAIME